MKRQSKWVTFLALVALCAQMTGTLASAGELEWGQFSGGNDMPLINPVEPISAVPMIESYDIPDWANTPPEPLSPSNPIEGDADDCTRQHVPAVYSTIEPAPQVTQPPQPATPVTPATAENITIVPGVFPTPGSLTAGYPVTDETSAWGELGEVTSLNKKPTPALSTMDAPPGLRWTSVEGADRYVLELTITPTNGNPYGETIYIEGGSATSFSFTQSQLDSAQSISALMYAEQYSPCTHSGILRISNSSSTVTYTLTQQSGDDQDDQGDQVQEETRLQTPVLSFDPATRTYTWTEVPGAYLYEIRFNIDRGASHLESFTSTIMAGAGCFYPLVDPDLFDGMLAVYASILVRAKNGEASEISDEVGYRFDAPTPEPVTGAPLLSFDPATRTFSWTEVPGAFTYELFVELAYADREPYEWSVCMADPPWPERAYSLQDMGLLEGAISVTGYVDVCLPDGAIGERSNVVRYAVDGMNDGEEIEWEDLSITEFGRPTTNQAYIDEVVRLVNVERAKAGLSPLSGGHAGLNAAAISRAQEIVTLFSHQRPDGTSYTTAMDKFGASGVMNGENIAAGSSTPKAVVEQWMNSKGHRENILNPGYQYIGVGHAEIAGSQYSTYWVQMFLTNPDYKAPDNTITSFALNGHSGTVNGNRITVVVPSGANVTSLAATSIVHTGESVTPAIGEKQDFTQPVMYTVSSAGTESVYTVRVVSQDTASGGGTGGSNTGDDRDSWLVLEGGWIGEVPSYVAETADSKSKSTAETAAKATGGSVEIRPDEDLEYARIIANSINVRSTPTRSRTNPLGEVQRGNVVIVVDRVENEEGAFLEICTYEDIVGFIPEEYAEPFEVTYTMYIWSDGVGGYRADRSADAAPDALHVTLVGSIEFVDGLANSCDGHIPEDVYEFFAAEYAK